MFASDRFRVREPEPEPPVLPFIPPDCVNVALVPAEPPATALTKTAPDTFEEPLVDTEPKVEFTFELNTVVEPTVTPKDSLLENK
jgi:hypothetical protein